MSRHGAQLHLTRLFMKNSWITSFMLLKNRKVNAEKKPCLETEHIDLTRVWNVRVPHVRRPRRRRSEIFQTGSPTSTCAAERDCPHVLSLHVGTFAMLAPPTWSKLQRWKGKITIRMGSDSCCYRLGQCMCMGCSADACRRDGRMVN